MGARAELASVWKLWIDRCGRTPARTSDLPSSETPLHALSMHKHE